MDVLSCRWMRRPAFLALLLAGLFLPSCNSTNPVEPERPGDTPPPSTGPGTDALSIDIAANPNPIPPGSTNPAKITITVSRGGVAVAAGTTGAITTSTGSFNRTRSVTGMSFTLGDGGQTVLDFFPPSDAGTAKILVQVDDASRQFDLAVQIAPFFVTAVKPNLGSAEGGTQVTIMGAGFIDPVRVTFGNVVATGVKVSSDNTMITAVSPRSPTPVDTGTTLTVDIKVTNGLNQSQPTSDTLLGGFTYVNGPTDPPPSQDDRPSVFSVVPASGPNSGGQRVAILGAGFVPPVQVFFGFSDTGGFEGIQADVLSASATRIEVETPPANGFGQSLVNQLVDIFVRNQGTGFSTVSSSAYRYQGTGLLIESVNPRTSSIRGGQRVLVTGHGFRSPMQVVFAGIAQTVLAVRAREIDVETVAVDSSCNPPSGPVSVTTLDNNETATSSIIFTYTGGQIVLQSVSPAQIPAGGGDVTLTGTLPGNANDLRVEIGGAAATIKNPVTGGYVVTAPAFTGTFDTESCDDNGDGTSGTRAKNTSVDVKVTSLSNGCSDTLPKALAYKPSDTTCQGDTGPPVADFEVSAADTAGLRIRFRNRSTGGTATRFDWSFGDGTFSTQENPTHTYADPGVGQVAVYTVRLTVSNAAGSSSAEKQIRIPLTPAVSPPP